jgi:hypothetical protein
MNMLGHQDIAPNDKAIPLTHRLKFTLEDTVRTRIAQQRLPSITTEGKKVKDSALLVADKPLRHDGKILQPIPWPGFVVTHPSLEKSEGWGTQTVSLNQG